MALDRGWEGALNVSANTCLNEHLEEIMLKCGECAPWICVHYFSPSNQKGTCFQRRKMCTLSKCFFIAMAMKPLTNNYLTSIPFSGTAEGSYQTWPVVK